MLVLTGAGSSFCAGMDLDNLKQLLGRDAGTEPEGFRNHGQPVSRAL